MAPAGSERRASPRFACTLETSCRLLGPRKDQTKARVGDTITLLNSKWRVSVDGRPEKVLRCDFLLRGVFLSRGKHRIVFLFYNRSPTLYVSLGSELLGLLLGVSAVVRSIRAPVATPQPGLSRE